MKIAGMGMVRVFEVAVLGLMSSIIMGLLV